MNRMGEEHKSIRSKSDLSPAWRCRTDRKRARKMVLEFLVWAVVSFPKMEQQEGAMILGG